MVPALPRTLLAADPWPRRCLVLFVALFGVTFAGYALGLFATSGGVVFLHADAALVGTAAASWVGFERGGLVPAWLSVYGALLGGAADHYVIGQSTGRLPQRVADLLSPDGLMFLGVEALVIGSLAFAVGWLGRGLYRRALER